MIEVLQAQDGQWIIRTDRRCLTRAKGGFSPLRFFYPVSGSRVGWNKKRESFCEHDGFTERKHGPHRLSMCLWCARNKLFFLIYFVPLACSEDTETCDEKRSPVSLMNHNHHYHTTLEDSLVFILQGAQGLY